MSTPDHIVVLERQQRLTPEQVLPLLLGAGVLRADAIRAVRRQRGILLTRVDEETAGAAAQALTIAGIDAMAIPDADFPPLPRPVYVARMDTGDDGISLPAIGSLGKLGHTPWDCLRVIAIGLVLGKEHHSLKDMDKFLMSGTTTHDDHREFAKISFERHLNPAFPLNAYLLADPLNDINVDRLATGHKQQPGNASAKPSGIIRRMRRFDAPKPEAERYSSEHPGLKGYLCVWNGTTLYVLSAHEAAFSGRSETSAGHWLRAFHALVRQTVDGALSAAITPETHDFARAHDQATYIFEDEQALLDSVRWWIAKG